jgi:hypothetical protein
MKGSDVSKPSSTIDSILNYRLSGWLVAIAVVVLVVGVKFLLT